MMELPNYSGQLMQQLWTLRKEGHFCDCTILVGDSPHRAHKVVLAASSMLFRSLLEGSDTISIDTSLVSSQEFGSLLDMVYTGKLPVGKHNVGRIVAAADNLQMFDVAVGFKNVLTNLVSQRQAPVPTTPAAAHVGAKQSGQSLSPEGPASSRKDFSDSDLTKPKATERVEESQEPACKRANVELSASSAPEEEAKSTETAPEGNKSENEVPSAGLAGVLENPSQFVELLSNVSSVLELMSQAARSSLEEPERQVVCQCCEDPDPGSALEKLLSRVREERLSEDGLITLLRTVQQKESTSFPPSLLPLLEEEGKKEEEPKSGQTRVSDEPEGSRSEEEEGEEGEDNVDMGEEEEEEEEEEDDKEPEGEEKTAGTSSSSPTRPFTCRWCKKEFAYKCRMQTHVKRCALNREREQQCPQCPARLPNTRALRRHQSKAHCGASAKKKVPCDVCGRAFAHPSGMIYHKRTEHFDEKPFACDVCDAKFGANSSLKNHMRLHTGEKPYRCKHCDMSFSVAAALAYHTKKKHSEGKMYECQYCKATFAQSIELTRHVRTHTGDRPYVCRECGKGYSQASGLTIHLNAFHNVSEPSDCQKCCLSFPSAEEHCRHMETAHPHDFHKCSVCSRVFTSAALLEKHAATHAVTKPYRCDLCNKSYQQLSGLWYHNRINHPDVFANHTRQLKTLVQCEICYKFFPSAASLAKHQAAAHQGASALALQCPFCPVLLAGGEELQEHISSQHMGQSGAVLGCPLCDLLFASHPDLQDHLLSCHVEAAGEATAEAAGESASVSNTVISAVSGGAGSVLSEDQAQRVILALTGGGVGGSSGEVVEVNMFELLDNAVAFVCEDKPTGTHSS